MTELFVTGTDTGVGKTTTACAILAAARRRGWRARAMKPVETGCASDPDRPRALVPADALALARAAHGDRGRFDASPGGAPPDPSPHGLSTIYRFAAPLAPAVAAKQERLAIDLAPILRAADRLRSHAPDLFLVEGAGGLLVPLTDELDIADLAAALAVPLLIVARDGLGTINHTRLTVEAARARGLAIAGVILCAAIPGTSDRDARSNAEEIARTSHVRVLGRLPFLPAASLPQLAEAAESHLDLATLLSGTARDALS